MKANVISPELKTCGKLEFARRLFPDYCDSHTLVLFNQFLDRCRLRHALALLGVGRKTNKLPPAAQQLLLTMRYGMPTHRTTYPIATSRPADPADAAAGRAA